MDASKIIAEGKGKSNPITKPGECGAKRSAATIACLQPDRRVELEVSATAQ
jgi:OOP family OmpA-OmpF porin